MHIKTAHFFLAVPHTRPFWVSAAVRGVHCLFISCPEGSWQVSWAGAVAEERDTASPASASVGLCPSGMRGCPSRRLSGEL